MGISVNDGSSFSADPHAGCVEGTGGTGGAASSHDAPWQPDALAPDELHGSLAEDEHEHTLGGPATLAGKDGPGENGNSRFADSGPVKLLSALAHYHHVRRCILVSRYFPCGMPGRIKIQWNPGTQNGSFTLRPWIIP